MQRTFSRHLRKKRPHFPDRRILVGLGPKPRVKQRRTAARERGSGVERNPGVGFLIEDARVEPMITLRADENWVEFTVRYIVDYKQRRTVKDLLFTRILEEVEASDGRIQIASAAFEITNVTPPRDETTQ